MTPRERLNAALQHQQPDRTPYFEYVLLSPLADRFLGRTYGGDPVHWDSLVSELGWEEAVRRNAADRVELAVRLEHDLIYATPVPPPPSPQQPSSASSAAPPPPSPAPSTTSAPERSDDPVANLQRRNQAAAAAGPPSDDPLLIYVHLREEMEQQGIDLMLLAPGYGHGVWTDVDLMQSMILDPEVAYRHFHLATRSGLALIDRYHALSIEQVGVGGDFAGNRPIISPTAYRQFIVPEVARLSRRLHELGMYAVNASDGDLWPVIDDFLLGCEVDGYLEIDQYAGMDLPRLKEQFGDTITLYGNLDCGTVLSFATPDEIRRHVIDCLDAGQGNGGHIFCASNAITASVSLENYLAAISAYRDYFSLPQLDV
jgi:uroporphyrinogen decarboxylase-like protein